MEQQVVLLGSFSPLWLGGPEAIQSMISPCQNIFSNSYFYEHTIFAMQQKQNKVVVTDI